MTGRHGIERSGGDFSLTWAWQLARLVLGGLTFALLLASTWPH